MKANVAAVAAAAIPVTMAAPSTAPQAPLLDRIAYGQLECWLGAGPLCRDNLYARQPQ